MTNRRQLSFVTLLGFPLLLLTFRAEVIAQENKTGCSTLDKSKPPLFISYEQPVDKEWAVGKYEKGVMLRLNNNSDCSIVFSVQEGDVPRVPPNFVIRNGKFVRQQDVVIGSLTNGQSVSLEYYMKYPNQKYMVIGGFGGDVLETAWLNGGDHVFFSVPLRNFKKDGELLIQYNYDWDYYEASQIITEKNGIKQRYETVEHYLRFEPRQLPQEILK